MSRPERLALVDRDDPVLPIVEQCRLLKLARSTLYYRPAPVSADDLAVMRRMDELHLAWPFYGSRRMAAVLRREGWEVNRKRAKRLMRVMEIEAIYQKPNTSKGHPDHKVYPHLLRGLTINRPNQVWCADDCVAWILCPYIKAVQSRSGDWLKIGGQAASAIGGNVSFAGWNFCP